MRVVRIVTCALVLWSSAGLGEELSDGQGWSVLGGRTAGERANALNVEAGWPGLYVGYQRGLAPVLDVGLRVGFAYGVQGLVSQVMPGLSFQGLVKVRLLEGSRVSLALAVEPGPFFHFDRFGFVATAGFVIPVGLRLGIVASHAVALGLSLDVPLWVRFGAFGGVWVPLLTGLGVEYFVRSDLAVFARTRMGPTIGPGGRAEFTLEGLLGVGWRF